MSYRKRFLIRLGCAFLAAMAANFIMQRFGVPVSVLYILAGIGAGILGSLAGDAIATRLD